MLHELVLMMAINIQ